MASLLKKRTGTVPVYLEIPYAASTAAEDLSDLCRYNLINLMTVPISVGDPDQDTVGSRLFGGLGYDLDILFVKTIFKHPRGKKSFY
jgi:hypothetical protein